MPRIPWSKVAKELKEKYMDGLKCKLCGAEVEDAGNALKTLSNIYRHFKELHPEKVSEVVKSYTE